LKANLSKESIAHFKEHNPDLKNISLSSYLVFEEFEQKENELFVNKFSLLDSVENAPNSVQLNELQISDSQLKELETVENFGISVPMLSDEQEEQMSNLKYFELKTQNTSNEEILNESSQKIEKGATSPKLNFSQISVEGSPNLQTSDSISTQLEEEMDQEEQEPKEIDFRSEEEEDSKIPDSEEESQNLNESNEITNMESPEDVSDFSLLHGAVEDDSFREAFEFTPVGKSKELEVEIIETPKKKKESPYASLFEHSYTPKKKKKNLHSNFFRVFVEKIQGNTKLFQEVIKKKEQEYLSLFPNEISSPNQTPVSSILIRKKLTPKSEGKLKSKSEEKPKNVEVKKRKLEEFFKIPEKGDVKKKKKIAVRRKSLLDF
jgi:hypothetical protein